MSKEILSLKAKPTTIPHILEIIQEHEGDIDQIKREVVQYLQQESIRKKKPSERILFYAVTIPSLRKLQLLKGEGANIGLSPNGRILVDTYHSSGINGFKKEFAYLLINIDMENGNTINVLQKNSPISINDLANKINSNDNATLDRLRRWLNYLKFVDLIKFENNQVILRVSQLKACLEKKNLQFDEHEFIEILLAEYRLIRHENKGLIYAPIPLIRDRICERFSDRGMWTWDFDKRLFALPRETDTYIIQFTQPMERKEGGILNGNRYYYYLHIHEKGNS